MRATPPRAACAIARHRPGAAACASRALHLVASAPTAHTPRVAADRAITCTRELRPYADHRPSGVDVGGRHRLVPLLQRLCPTTRPSTTLRAAPTSGATFSPAPPAVPPLLARVHGRGAPGDRLPLERPRGGSVGRRADLARVSCVRVRADECTGRVPTHRTHTSLTRPVHPLMVCHASCTCWQAQCRWSRPRAPPLAAAAPPRRGRPNGSIFDLFSESSPGSRGRARATRRLVQATVPAPGVLGASVGRVRQREQVAAAGTAASQSAGSLTGTARRLGECEKVLCTDPTRPRMLLHPV